MLGRAAARPDARPSTGSCWPWPAITWVSVDEARGDCDRALERLGSSLADEATHDVAIEALMTIHGLGVHEAEAALFDVVFPAEPFGPP